MRPTINTNESGELVIFSYDTYTYLTAKQVHEMIWKFHEEKDLKHQKYYTNLLLLMTEYAID